MNRKLPNAAFEFYFGLGVRRSYVVVAQNYGVAKKTVVAHALRERWQSRLLEREQEAQQEVERKAVETLADVKAKHLRMLEVIQAKGLHALKTMPIETAYQAVRAIVSAIQQERVIRGEPGQRTAIEIEGLFRQDQEMLLLERGEDDDWDDVEEPAEKLPAPSEG